MKQKNDITLDKWKLEISHIIRTLINVHENVDTDQNTNEKFSCITEQKQQKLTCNIQQTAIQHNVMLSTKKHRNPEITAAAGTDRCMQDPSVDVRTEQPSRR